MEKSIKNFKSFIKKIDCPIYIAGHIRPDHDSTCACLALARLLESQGKTAYVLLEESDKKIAGINIEQRFIVGHVNAQAFFMITLDLNENYRLGKFEKFLELAKGTINIDHHQGNKTNANLIISHPEKSSTCEIIYEIISSYGEKYIDKSIAEYLYTGIMTDTKCFSRRLSNKTLSIAQNLINKGVDYEKILSNTHNHRTIYQLKALSKLVLDLQETEYFHYVVIDKTIPKFAKLTHNEIVKIIAEELRKIENIDILLIITMEKENITCKCISNISKNAHIIANIFSGGGHPGEAGFTTNLSCQEILDKTTEFLKNNKTFK